jgi:membrane-bound lytic murein transglycosylase D
MAVLGFSLVQASRATGIRQNMNRKIVIADTSINKDSLGLDKLAVNDPKQGFKNLFTTAVTGDGINGARLNPMGVTFIQNYIGRNKKGFMSMKEWAKPYFDMMDDVLSQHGIPKEMKYLAVIESGLKFNAISWAGACGPWAFMPAAAQQYGLSIRRGNDERLDYVKSTHAAARLLTDLYQKYGDWLLVLAAYNGGPGNVDKAIRKSGGSKDFWTLQYNLPVESMNHVKKFIGTHYIFEGEGGITTVTKSEMKDLLVNGSSSDLKEDEMSSSTVKKITSRLSSNIIIKYIDFDMVTFNRYNPNFDNEMADKGEYNLRLPIQKMNKFIEKREKIWIESIEFFSPKTTSNIK